MAHTYKWCVQMSRKYNLKDIIPEILREKGPLNKKNILETIIKQNNDINQISSKTMDENILNLLKSDTIQISGYQFDGYKNRMQNIKSDYLLFDVVKTLPFEINVTIKQLKSEDPKILRESYQELKNLFRKKYREIQDDYYKSYKEWEKSLKLIPISDALAEIEEIESHPFFSNKYESQILKIKNILIQNDSNKCIWIASELNKKTDIRSVLMGHGIVIEYRNQALIDLPKPLFRKEDIITFILGLMPPKKMDLKSVDMLFEAVLSYLNIGENNKYHDLFSKALSDNFDSFDAFKKVILISLDENIEKFEIDMIEKRLKWWEPPISDFLE